MNDKEPSISLGKKLIDKFFRAVTGTYEEKSCVEISSINGSYNKFFGRVPEVLNLGENFSNRQELSVATFKIDYWIDQLSGKFYEDCERIIDVACSYEMERRQRFVKGYTDDPIHLFLYDIKQYAVKLSRTDFDIEDIIEAKKWQNLFRELIINQVFPADHKDTRQQVLFDLEQTFKKSIIPRLEMANENKSALEHLKSVSAHLTKFLDIGFKYLFYIGRDSDYVANFSIRKLRIMKSKCAEVGETLGITETERKFLEPIKDTWPIEILYRIFVKSEQEKEKEHLALVSMRQGKEIDIYSEGFAAPVLLDKQITQLLDHGTKKPDYYARHIDLRYFINAHLLLAELAKFKELFDIAKSCAEMGGNLLTFGLLREQLVNDVQDCSKYLYAIKSVCDVLEGCAWEAFRKHASGQIQIPDKWKDNYTKSAVTYFNSLDTCYDFCQSSLMNLAAAATKKSRSELIVETEKVVNKYIKVHSKHRNYREATLQKLHHLPSFNSFLSSYNLYKNPLISSSEDAFSIGNNAKDDFKKFKRLQQSGQISDYAEVSKQYFHKYAPDVKNHHSQYYTGRFLSKSYDKNSQLKAKDFYQSTLKTQPHFFKANYRLSQMVLLDGNLNEAKKCILAGITSYEENAKQCALIGAQIDTKPLDKMLTLRNEITHKQSVEDESKIKLHK